MNILLEVLAGVLWLCLLVVYALRLQPSNISDFELQRTASSGDPSAKQEVQLRRYLPELRALRRLVGVLVATVFVVITSYVVGPWWGIVLSIAAFVLLEATSRIRLIARWVDDQLWRYWPGVLRFIKKFRWLLTFFTRRTTSHTVPFWSKEELLDTLEHDKTVLEQSEKIAIRQALRYHKTTIKQIMTPREKIVYLKVNDTLGPLLLDELHKTRHACFPVVQGDLDRVVGLLYLQDVATLNPHAKRVKDGMWPHVFYLHQDEPLDHLWAASLQSGRHLFIVVNDKKETIGLVTMHDALHQLLGRNLANTRLDYEDFDVAELSDTPSK